MTTLAVRRATKAERATNQERARQVNPETNLILCTMVVQKHQLPKKRSKQKPQKRRKQRRRKNNKQLGKRRRKKRKRNTRLQKQNTPTPSSFLEL